MKYYANLTNILLLFVSLQLIARMTKHGWFDGDKKVFVFRDILDEAGKFLRVRKKVEPINHPHPTHTNTNY